jgi:hypothetical protein
MLAAQGLRSSRKKEWQTLFAAHVDQARAFLDLEILPVDCDFYLFCWH